MRDDDFNLPIAQNAVTYPIVKRLRAHTAGTTRCPTSRELTDIAATMIEELAAALEFFADDDNWRLNGKCDPNSGNFIGRLHARAALANLKGETNG